MCRPDTSISRADYLSRHAWAAKVDMNAFKADMDALGRRLRSQEGKKDEAHLQKLINVCDALLVVGLAGLGMSPWYVFSWACLGVAITLRWCALAHHVSHGGYNRCASKEYQRGCFAVGGWFARCRDWLDWMLPEAWDVEHNSMHHYATNEMDDPDFPERNLQPIRDWDVPIGVRYANVAALVLVWKWMYYACNTWKNLIVETNRKNGKKYTKKELARMQDPIMMYQIIPGFGTGVEWGIMEPVSMFARVFAPYVIFRWVLPVAFFYVVGGSEAMWNTVINLGLTEIWANVHSFCLVVPNHAGDDLYCFETHVKANTASFYMRQIISSVDYHTGSDPSRPEWLNDLIDGSQGWLNYQIEHHCFPNMSMLSYRKAQPEIKAICEKHGIPYVQRPIWERVHKVFRLGSGEDTMMRFPVEFEAKDDQATPLSERHEVLAEGQES